ncbi:MAG: dTDP-4-dehydrorhamnose 3,5-epimerase [Culicoidibacterales bacterium]
MKVVKTKIQDLVIIEPDVFGDHRGWFSETYNKEKFEAEGLFYEFVQDNQSYSATKGTLRGLHYQLAPKAQTKLIRATLGTIFDVAVDLRKDSPTFGQWFGIELSAENKKQLLIPKGFAHGFMTLTEDVEVQYKVDELYSPEHDRSLLWSDETISINWPLDVEPVISDKDKNAPKLTDAEYNF